jgi:hypothetical protein
MIVNPEPYTGPFVTLRPDGPLYTVNVEPTLPDGLDRSRTFGCKSQAYGHARDLWSEHRLPFKDFSEGNTGQNHNRRREE